MLAFPICARKRVPSSMGSGVSSSTPVMAGLKDGSLRESATVSNTRSSCAAMRTLPVMWATPSCYPREPWLTLQRERNTSAMRVQWIKLRQSLPGEQDARTFTPVRILAGRVVRPGRALRDGHAIGGTLTSHHVPPSEPTVQGDICGRQVPPIVEQRARVCVFVRGHGVDLRSWDVRGDVDVSVWEIGRTPVPVPVGDHPGGYAGSVVGDPGDGLVQQAPCRWPV